MTNTEVNSVEHFIDNTMEFPPLVAGVVNSDYSDWKEVHRRKNKNISKK